MGVAGGSGASCASALAALEGGRPSRAPAGLPPPTRLGDAVELVGRLGGWLGRRRAPPGAQLLWHGYTQLAAMVFAFELRDEYG